MSADAIPCPGCGTPATGKFCSECGAALVGAKCSSCKALLTPGALYCHRCGQDVGGARTRATTRHQPAAATDSRSVLPWVMAGIALLAVVIMVARQQSTVAPTTDAPLGGAGVARGPDISQMTPQERADRLFDRVMRLSAEGKGDSAAFFASMAVGAYASLAPLNADQRYDMGRMAEMAGDVGTAKAQADSILREQPDHMLGIILDARAIMARGDSARGMKALARLRAVETTERAKALEEYERHRSDIDAALSLVRGGPSGTAGKAER